MKKLLAIVLVIAAGSMIFTSCSKDETKPAPTISVTNNKTTYLITATADTTITFNVTVKAEAEIDQFTIKKTVGSTTTSYGNPTGYSGKTDYVYNFQETFTPSMSYPISFTFKVIDKEGQEASITVTIEKINSPTTTPLNTEITNGVIWNLIGPNKGAWDLVNNVGVSSSEPDANKDMKNTTTVNDGWKNEWTSMNGTMFVKANSYDYNNATLEAAVAAYNAGTPSTTVTNPAVGDIYIAKLRGGNTYVVIKVTNIDVTANDNLDKIEFSYKKQ